MDRKVKTIGEAINEVYNAYFLDAKEKAGEKNEKKHETTKGG